MIYSTNELQEMINRKYEINPETNDLDAIEDLSIVQKDGSLACLAWELAGKGFQVFDPLKEREENF